MKKMKKTLAVILSATMTLALGTTLCTKIALKHMAKNNTLVGSCTLKKVDDSLEKPNLDDITPDLKNILDTITPDDLAPSTERI